MHVVNVPPGSGFRVHQVTAACLGALVGGALIWVLDVFVFTAGVPGVGEQFIDWVAPIAGAVLFAWLEPWLVEARLAPPPAEAPK
jgi:hypothetical protein